MEICMYHNQNSFSFTFLIDSFQCLISMLNFDANERVYFHAQHDGHGHLIRMELISIFCIYPRQKAKLPKLVMAQCSHHQSPRPAFPAAHCPDHQAVRHSRCRPDIALPGCIPNVCPSGPSWSICIQIHRVKMSKINLKNKIQIFTPFANMWVANGHILFHLGAIHSAWSSLSFYVHVHPFFVSFGVNVEIAWRVRTEK